VGLGLRGSGCEEDKLRNGLGLLSRALGFGIGIGALW